VRYDIGDGTKVLFWHDVWCGERLLKLVYSALFNVACNNLEWLFLLGRLPVARFLLWIILGGGVWWW
jgi:hypothetical protein